MDMALRDSGAVSVAPRPAPRFWAALIVCAIVFGGCKSASLRQRETFKPCVSQLAAAQADLATADRLESEGRDACVDLYYRAASEAWRQVESGGASPAEFQLACQIYQQSLAGLIDAGQKHGRLDPSSHLSVAENGSRVMVPVTHHGFAWRPEDFNQLTLVGPTESKDISHYYRTPGLGVRLIAFRVSAQEEPYFRQRHPFPATALLRSTGTGSVLELYNPYMTDHLPLGRGAVRMERDLTAPLALTLQKSSGQYLEGFLAPFDTDVRPKLMMVEPYQPGKIPVVFIHGLLSDPSTWFDMGNELRAQPDLYQRFQFWGFRYPTGGALLESAAELREKLLMARQWCDPNHQDPALDRMVLVGHSMGGLVSRLQVTYSSDVLWRHVARQPLEAVRADPAMRERLRRQFFFSPLPTVTRVVFIGTPHRGSGWSRRVIGRLGSSLVRPSAEHQAEYRRLMDDNCDIFYPFLRRSPPTSIDLLEPSSPLLAAIGEIPFSRCVRLHSIIGTGGDSLFGEPGDGIVPVSSARLCGVESELLVPARHEELHHDPATMAELMRILRKHAREPMVAGRLPSG
jgi:pimeloyl-ACP methyl ester carboxylesterase